MAGAAHQLAATQRTGLCAALLQPPHSSLPLCILVSGQMHHQLMCIHLLNPGDVQTCSWVEECGVPGCANKCILNILTNKNSRILESRQYGDGSWQMCPELALWVNLTRPGDKRKSSVRKLQEVSSFCLPCQYMLAHLATHASLPMFANNSPSSAKLCTYRNKMLIIHVSC